MLIPSHGVQQARVAGCAADRIQPAKMQGTVHPVGQIAQLQGRAAQRGEIQPGASFLLARDLFVLQAPEKVRQSGGRRGWGRTGRPSGFQRHASLQHPAHGQIPAGDMDPEKGFFLRPGELKQQDLGMKQPALGRNRRTAGGQKLLRQAACRRAAKGRAVQRGFGAAVVIDPEFPAAARIPGAADGRAQLPGRHNAFFSAVNEQRQLHQQAQGQGTTATKAPSRNQNHAGDIPPQHPIGRRIAARAERLVPACGFWYTGCIDTLHKEALSMEWKQLLSGQKLADGPALPDHFARFPINTFELDYSNLVSSAAFRRLQDKTQVYPLDKGDFVRTRLTHSIEVSSVARQLGMMLTDDRSDYARTELREFRTEIPSVLACVALLHDLGNPPFGHFGEALIGEWFRGALDRLTYKGKPLRH